MSNHVSSAAAYIVCPFYIGDDKLSMICEGVVDYTTIKTNFKNRAAATRHIDMYCKDSWHDCPISKTLSKKYEQEP